MARRVGLGLPAAAGTVVFLLGLLACAGLPIPDAAAPGRGVQASESPRNEQGESGFDWVPFGPADPKGPSAWYRSLEDGKCAGVRDNENTTLVQALAAVCRAAFEHQRSEWAVAEQLSRQGLTDSSAPACLNTAARALVDRALSWHAGHQNADPVVMIARAGDPVACEFKITRVDPAEGPLGGGTRVQISGAGLNEVDKVLFGDVAVKVEDQHTDTENGATVDILTVTTPAGQGPGMVDVSVVNRAGVTTAKSAFTYVATTPTQPPTTSAPAPAPPAPAPSTAEIPPPPPPAVAPSERRYPSVPHPGPRNDFDEYPYEPTDEPS